MEKNMAVEWDSNFKFPGEYHLHLEMSLVRPKVAFFFLDNSTPGIKTTNQPKKVSTQETNKVISVFKRVKIN